MLCTVSKKEAMVRNMASHATKYFEKCYGMKLMDLRFKTEAGKLAYIMMILGKALGVKENRNTDNWW